MLVTVIKSYDFSADYFALDYQLRGLSQGKTNIPFSASISYSALARDGAI